jgi:hypothetical protein
MVGTLTSLPWKQMPVPGAVWSAMVTNGSVILIGDCSVSIPPT